MSYFDWLPHGKSKPSTFLYNRKMKSKIDMVCNFDNGEKIERHKDKINESDIRKQQMVPKKMSVSYQR